MANMNWVNNLIEEKLLMLNTCFLAKVISTDGKRAKVLPLGKRKEYGKEAVDQTPLTVPIANSAKYKFTSETLTHVTDTTVSTTNGTINYLSDVDISTSSSDGYLTSARASNSSESASFLTSAKAVNTKETKNMVTVNPLEAGDIVVCVCADRNITAALKGENSVPPVGHHSQSDAIIVGII